MKLFGAAATSVGHGQGSLRRDFGVSCKRAVLSLRAKERFGMNQ